MRILRPTTPVGPTRGRGMPAQQMDPAMEPEAGHRMQHRMFRLPLGDWHVAGMGQVFPVVTTGGPDNGEGGELRRTEWYLTQPEPRKPVPPACPPHDAQPRGGHPGKR